MKTTELIAEILVIGVGTALWIAIFLFALYPELQTILTSPDIFSLLLSMAFVYVLGLITDKSADIFFLRFVPHKYDGMSVDEIADWKNKRDH